VPNAARELALRISLGNVLNAIQKKRSTAITLGGAVKDADCPSRTLIRRGTDIMSIELPHIRPLDDIDVREEESDPEIIAGDRIEFATFVEGEYVESILISRARATEVYRNLGELLGKTSSTSRAIMSSSTRTTRPLELAVGGNPLDATSYTYRVAWLIDLEAASPQEAAAKARRIQLNPDSIATVFEVQNRDGTTVYIDTELSEESH
jgi:hypothetical protein